MAPKSIKKVIRKMTEHQYIHRQHHHHHRCHHPHQYSRRHVLSPISESLSPIVTRSKSISTCCQHLINLFSKISLIKGPNHSCHDEYEMLKQEIEQEEATKAELVLLPPLNPNKRGTIFLDLDETLVHSTHERAPALYDFVIKPNFNGQLATFYVLKRPGVDKFLQEISKEYEVVIFTASLKPYAEMVLDHLDPKGVLFSHHLYREACRELGGKFVKDLSRVGRDLSKVVIVDDNPHSYSLQPENGIPLTPFICDFSDRELRKLMRFFEACDLSGDMRDAVKHYLDGVASHC